MMLMLSARFFVRFSRVALKARAVAHRQFGCDLAVEEIVLADQWRQMGLSPGGTSGRMLRSIASATSRKKCRGQGGQDQDMAERQTQRGSHGTSDAMVGKRLRKNFRTNTDYTLLVSDCRAGARAVPSW